MRFFSVGFPLAFAFGWFLLLEDFLGHVGAGVATCWDIVGAPLGDQVDLVLGRDLDGDGCPIFALCAGGSDSLGRWALAGVRLVLDWDEDVGHLDGVWAAGIFPSSLFFRILCLVRGVRFEGVCVELTEQIFCYFLCTALIRSLPFALC